ncbi:MAG: hypothetical protein ACLP7P_08585 [Rhodomicrobium sp.]
MARASGANIPRPIEFGHTSNPDKSGFASSQRLLNGYAEQIGKTAKSPLPVYATPGTTRWDIGTSGLSGPCRGMWYVYGKGLYVVCGSRCALFATDGTATLCTGTVPGADMVTMADNQNGTPQVAIVSEGYYSVLNTGTNTITQPNIANLPAPNSVCFVDGYLVFSIPDGRIFHTDLNDALTVNALAFAYVASRSGGFKRIVTFRGALICLKESSFEIWEDAGTTPFAFARIRADIDIGCLASHSVADVAETLVWVDQFGVVRQLTSSEPQRISTHAVERAITALSAIEKNALYGVYTQFNGHQFYALTSPYWTWEYDLATGLWHERQSGGLSNWFGNASALYGGRQIIGSALDSSLHYLDDTAYTESGNEYLFLAQSSPVHAFPRGLIFDEINADIIPGAGIPGSDADAANPKIVLDWSDDGGKTWKGGRVASLGAAGQRLAVAHWYQLGATGRNGRTFRLSASSSVMRGIFQADARARPIIA